MNSRPILKLTLCLALMLAGNAVFAQRQMEKLGRGVIAMRTNSTQVYIGWRMLGTDPENIGFKLYRVASGVTNVLNGGNLLTNTTDFVDTPPSLTVANTYFVQPVTNGVGQPFSGTYTLIANAPTQQYISIPLTAPPGGTEPATGDGTDAGGPYTYNANDCSVGDVDGDGEYEIILKWDPSNSKDNSQSGFTGDTYLDCYKLNGTRLWRIDLGPNIRSGAHYLDFMVYDYDGDGKAEVMCRTAPGSRDGLGNYVGGTNKWQNANGPHPTFNDTDDYRTTGPNGTNGYVLAGPEFLTVFNGQTGEEMTTATFYPKRDQDNNDDNPTAARINAIWGDSYGNRIDRFLAGVAYVDGKQPSGIFCRGYYTRAFLTAWDWRNGQLTRRWSFDSNDGNPANLAYRGQGAHSLTVGDVDGDGKDEITYGACAIDDDGTGLYSTGLGHGDAEHLSDMNPSRPGQEVWMVHEDPASYGSAGLEFRDARTGALIFGVDGQNSDVGRGVAYDIDPRYPGYEMWGARGGLMSSTGVQINANHPSQMNFCVWWDADLLRESLDGTTIYKWDWTNSVNNSILSPAGIASNNGTKATPCLSADILGDWREEVIWRASDNSELRIYTTIIPATNRLYTLMHNPQYRCAIAWQNTGYNQPPHPGFFLGQDMRPQPLAPISNAKLVWRGASVGNTWDTATANWLTNNVWTTNNPATTFNSGDTVLFDISGSNQVSINFPSAISPGKVTVFSPKDYVFSGAGSLAGATALVKAGQGRLTINTTNNYTGPTTVSGGTLIVNGSLDGSPVTVERRGTPEGTAQFGGGGRLGQGLTVQKDCGLMVGPDTNAAGTLTVSNSLTELGNVLNQFDLSNDPTGITKTNDRVNIVGNFVVTGTNTIQINQPDGFLGGGVYPLFSYSGTLTGGLTNFALSGTFIQSVVLTNPPGAIALLAIVPAAPPNAPSSLIATAIGAFQINLVWQDNSSDENAFLIERSTNNVNFAQIASVSPNTTNYSDIGLLASTTYYYRVRGTNLAGASGYSNTTNATTTATPPSLTWRGDNTANVWDIATTANWLNGTNVTLYADGSFVTFDATGSNSLPVNLSTTLQPGSVTVTGTKSYTFGGAGSLTGTTSLVKSGTGTLTVNTTNTYSGGTILSNGTVIPGNAGVNLAGFGSGPVIFDGGTLEFTGFTGSSSPDYLGNTNALIVPTNQTGTIHVPQRFLTPGLGGPLSGSGTLNLVVTYVRGDISGNWTNFTGKINVTSNGSITNDFRVVNALGFPNARLSLGSNVLMYSRASAGSVIPIGEFAASGSGTTISANGGSGAGSQNAVTWRVGELNTDATNAALIQSGTSLIKEGSGKWTLTGANTYTGTTTVNAGTLLINGDQSGSTSLFTVGTGGTLGGSGIIGGNTTINGTLSPGNSIGTLTFNTNLTLSGSSTAFFELTRVPLTNDVARVLGTVTYGGTLNVVNLSPDFLQAGDNFRLFNAAAYGGAFTGLILPDLNNGLTWSTNKLAVDGRLWVVKTTPPAITKTVLSGNNKFTFQGGGGTPKWDYYVLASTNIMLPLSQWTRILTNQFDATSGNFSVTNSINPGLPQQFYLLQMP
jgi:rhamnogalacturonan endolyase